MHLLVAQYGNLLKYTILCILSFNKLGAPDGYYYATY